MTRRSSAPEGAVTLARTILESVCKHALDDCGVDYGDAEMPKLWALTSQKLNLLPSQHDEDAFRRILGNCQAVVDGIANVRNRVEMRTDVAGSRCESVQGTRSLQSIWREQCRVLF